MLEKNNRFNYGVDSGRGDAQNLSNLQNAYPSSRHSWLSMGVKGAVLGLGLATLLPLTAFSAEYPGPWPGTNTVGGVNIGDVNVTWESDEGRTPEGIYLTYGTPIDDTYVLQGRIHATKDRTDVTSTGKFQFVVGQILYPIGGPYDVFAYFFLDPSKSTLLTDDYNGRQHQYLYVEAGVPELKWDTPEAITYGTLLSATQLNATCLTIDAASPTQELLQGSYTYDPAAGTLLDAGTHTLTVTFVPANTNYLTVSTNVDIVVNKADLGDKFSWGDPTLDTLTYGATFTKDNIHYTATVPGTISAKEKATGDDKLNTQPNAGEYPLTLIFTPDSDNYNPETVERTLIVNKATPVLDPDSPWLEPDRVEKGTQFAKDAIFVGINGEDLEGTYIYDPPLPVTLDQVPSQTLTVTFTPTGNDAVNYKTTSETRTVEVFEKTPVTLIWATPDDITYGTPLKLGKEELGQLGIKVEGIQLNALAVVSGTQTPVDGRYVYIPEEGKYDLPVGRHELKVTFTPTDTDAYGTASTNVWINVLKAKPIVNWEPLSPITYGTPLSADQLNATFTWTINGQEVEVRGTSVYDPDFDAILPVGTNPLKVTFTPADTDNYEVVTANAEVVVEKEDPTIEWGDQAGKLQDIVYGTALKLGEQLNAVAKDSTGAEISGTYAYDPAEGTILNAADDQPITVTFTPESDNYSTATKTVTINVLKATPRVTWENPDDIIYGTPLSENQLNASFTWNVDGQGEVTVDGTATYEPALGEVLTANDDPQTLKLVSFVPNGDSYRPEHPENYETVEAEAQIRVNRVALTITADDKSIAFGEDAPEYTYKITSGELVGTDEIEVVLTCDYAQNMDVGEYDIVPTFVPTATTDNYTITLVNGTLTVGVKEPDIIWAKPNAIPQGQPLRPGTDEDRGIFVKDVQLNALAVVDKNANPLVPIEGTYEYVPGEGANDEKNPLPAGENTLTVTFTPRDNNYKAATATVVLMVQAVPVITWEDQEITYGDKNKKFLNATVTADGKDISNLGNFKYKWVVGPIERNRTDWSGKEIVPTRYEDAGTYTATVSFDVNKTVTEEYATPKPVTVKVTINKATPVIAWNYPQETGKQHSDPTQAGLVPPEPLVYQLADITYGTELTNNDLNAYATNTVYKVLLKGSMIYTIPATKLPAGWNTLYATYTPGPGFDKNYDAVTVYNLIYVKHADLSDDDVTWVNAPFTVGYGTVLSDDQFTMIANVGGTPINGTVIEKKINGEDAIGKKPAVGNYTLTATFETDKTTEPSMNYNDKAKETTLAVVKAEPRVELRNPDPNNPNKIEIVYGTLINNEFGAATFTVINPNDNSDVEGTYTFDVYEHVIDPVTAEETWVLVEKDLTQEYLDVLIYQTQETVPYRIIAYFTPDDGDNYENAETDPYDLFVKKANPTLTVESIEYAYDAAKILTNDDFTATATGVADEDVAGEFTFYLDGIELSQKEMPLNMGTYKVTAYFTSADTNYKDGTVDAAADVTVYVYGSVYIDWNPVTTIEFGAPLTNADQLNAVALDAEDYGQDPSIRTVVPGAMTYTVIIAGEKQSVEEGTLLPVGEYTLRVDFEPAEIAGKYAEAYQEVTLSVRGKTPNVAWYPMWMYFGQTPGEGQYNARADIAGSFDYPEVWPTEVGRHTLTATFKPEDQNYATVDVDAVLVIMPAPVRFEWPAEDMEYGEAATDAKQFNATAYSVATGEKLGEEIGKFDYPRNEMPTEAGIYTLVAPWNPTTEYAGSYIAGIAYATIEIFATEPGLTWVTPDPITYGTALGGNQLNAVAIKVDGTPFGTTEGDYVYEPAAGEILAVGTHTLKVTFTPKSENYTPVSTTVELVVENGPIELTWNQPADITYGTALSEAQLNATATRNGEDVTALGTFAYVPNFGTVLPAGLNQPLTVTFTYDGDSATAATTIDVDMAIPTVTVNDPVAMVYGTTGDDFIAAIGAEASVAGEFSYEVVVPAISRAEISDITIDPSKELLPVSDDIYSLAVLFTPTDNDNYEAVKTYVDLTVNPTTPDIEIGDMSIVYGTVLTGDDMDVSATGVEGEAVPGTFIVYLNGEEFLEVTSPNAVLSAATAAIIEQPLPIGEYTVTAGFISDDTNYTAVDPSEVGSATLTVLPNVDDIMVVWEVAPSIPYGEAIKLNARAVDIVSGTILAKDEELQYSILIDTVEYELFPGTILDAGIIYQVKATFVGAGEYEGIEKDTGWLPVTVDPAEPTLSWEPAPLTYGTAATAAQENASANVAGKFTYPDMSKLPVGQNEVTATFVSEDPNFANGEVSAILEVTKATPVIRWATPAPITYGTLLSDEQLNASANVDGTFVYTPAAGAELEIGTYTLTTVFTPKDTANYNTATASVELEVIPNVEVELTWEPKTPITYGTALSVEHLNATANIEGHFYYNPTYGTILSAGKHKLAVIFIPTQRKYYKNQYMEVYIDVEKAEQTIEFEPIGVTEEGDVIELNATADSELPVRFVSSNEDVAVIQGNVLTIVGSGEAVITAIQDGNNNYEAASAEQTITVGDDVPALSISKASSAKGMVNAAADALVITFTGTLEESTDGVTWTPVADAKDGTYVVDVKVASQKFYRSAK